jgi:hypothetical protein
MSLTRSCHLAMAAGRVGSSAPSSTPLDVTAREDIQLKK